MGKKLDMKLTMGEFYDTCELLSLALMYMPQDEWDAAERWAHDIAERAIEQAHEAKHGNVGIAMMALFLSGAVAGARLDAEYMVEFGEGESDGD